MPTFLQPLVERGWLTLAKGVYTVTEEGQAVRWNAEKETDRLFYQGWDLSDEEIADMQTLMTQLTTAVSPPDQTALYEHILNLRGKNRGSL